MVLFRLFFGSGALNGKMLLVRIIEKNKDDAYFKKNFQLKEKKLVEISP